MDVRDELASAFAETAEECRATGNAAMVCWLEFFITACQRTTLSHNSDDEMLDVAMDLVAAGDVVMGSIERLINDLRNDSDEPTGV
jgi:hypothetical protein